MLLPIFGHTLVFRLFSESILISFRCFHFPLLDCVDLAAERGCLIHFHCFTALISLLNESNKTYWRKNVIQVSKDLILTFGTWHIPVIFSKSSEAVDTWELN
ncbi:hypothetical protein STAS_08172 [Striga asiatica]|uniref:Uncharacterized protein n=1 Tax=Striga asiatica TaxID=4170 RepID=A0A5A7PIG6_STRAF|nr:hypothetical protein STAS_08172 [Striga asiatica]